MMEQEVSVVNTFLQVSEVSEGRRMKFQRSRTAPVGTEALDEDEDEVAAEPEATGQEPKFEKVVEEEEEHEESQPELEKKTVKFLRTLPTWSRIETGDLGALADSLDDEPKELEPSYASGARRPPLIHSATPDQWEWEAMAQQERPAPAAPPSPPAAASQGFQAPVQPMQPMQPVQPMQPMQRQMPPQISLLTVPMMVPQGYPRLLGAVSPTHSSPKDSPKVSPRISPKHNDIRLGNLETKISEGREEVVWCVDGSRFDSHQERILSPEFNLNFPGQAEPFSFRMVILATQTGGKHGAGFKKARGRGSIELKCQSAVPPNVGAVTLNISMGHGSRKQEAPTAIWHNFADKTCCLLKNGEEVDWDFKQSIDGKGCEISVEVLDYQ